MKLHFDKIASRMIKGNCQKANSQPTDVKCDSYRKPPLVNKMLFIIILLCTICQRSKHNYFLPVSGYSVSGCPGPTSMLVIPVIWNDIYELK